MGDLVRALPRRDAGARPPAGAGGRTRISRSWRSTSTPRGSSGARVSRGIGVKALARYADPSGDALERLRAAGKALGLPTTLLIDKAGCELGVVAGAVKWDSPDALKLVEALKGG